MKNTYKIVLDGDTFVGKSALVASLVGGSSIYRAGRENIYIATVGVEVHSFRVNTNYGSIVFNLWDIAGKDKFRGIVDGYYIKGDAIIGVYSKDVDGSRNKAISMVNHFNEVTNSDKYVIACSKSDIDGSIVEDSNDYLVSKNNNTNKKEMFTNLLLQLTGHEDIEIV